MPALCGVGFTDVGLGHPGTDSTQFKALDFQRWRQVRRPPGQHDLLCPSTEPGNESQIPVSLNLNPKPKTTQLVPPTREGRWTPCR